MGDESWYVALYTWSSEVKEVLLKCQMGLLLELELVWVLVMFGSLLLVWREEQEFLRLYWLEKLTSLERLHFLASLMQSEELVLELGLWFRLCL